MSKILNVYKTNVPKSVLPRFVLFLSRFYQPHFFRSDRKSTNKRSVLFRDTLVYRFHPLIPNISHTSHSEHQNRQKKIETKKMTTFSEVAIEYAKLKSLLARETKEDDKERGTMILYRLF